MQAKGALSPRPSAPEHPTNTISQKIKCDETSPSCANCQAKGFPCPGYQKPVKWSTKHQPLGLLQNENESDWSTIAAELEAATAALTQSSSGGPESCPAEEDQGALASGPRSSPVVPGPSTSPAGLTTQEELRSVVADTASSNVDLVTSTLNEPAPTHCTPQATDILPHPLPTPPTQWTWPAADGRGFSNLSLSTPGLSSPSGANSPSVWLPLLTVPSLGEEDSLLISYYFASVCGINSCFVSVKDPLRYDLASAMSESPLIYHTVMSMAAAHLGAMLQTPRIEALEHQARAFSELQTEVKQLSKGISCCFADSSSSSLSDGFSAQARVLLAIILIGVSSVRKSVQI